MKEKIAWVVVALLIIWGLYALMNQKAQAPVTESNPDTPTSIYGLAVSDQKSGKSVTIESLRLPVSGFAVVYTAENYAPGKVLGYSKLLEAGTQTNVVVSLEKAVKAGDQLYILVHNDDNKNGVFDHLSNKATDAPGVDTNSQVVMQLVTVK